jgi:hypothetical protein
MASETFSWSGEITVSGFTESGYPVEGLNELGEEYVINPYDDWRKLDLVHSDYSIVRWLAPREHLKQLRMDLRYQVLAEKQWEDVHLFAYQYKGLNYFNSEQFSWVWNRIKTNTKSFKLRKNVNGKWVRDSEVQTD